MMHDDEETKQCKTILRRNNLNPIKKLGKGEFGQVYLVSRTHFTTYQTELLSVKCTNKQKFLKKPVLRRYLKQEIDLLKTLNHPNIVQLIQTFEESSWIFMVMEFCNMGNLAQLQKKKFNQIVPFPELKMILNDVIDGLMEMHSKKIIHRDIKLENILLINEFNGNKRTKICDLGFAREIQHQAETYCGTAYYMAPEIFERKKYTESVDVWSLGVLLFITLFGTYPFKGVNLLQQIQNKCQDGFELKQCKIKENSSITSSQMGMLSQLFRDIFMIDFKKRITLPELKDRLNEEHLQKQSLKETQPSENYDEETIQFHLQEVQFLQLVVKEVMNAMFLLSLEELALKYYVDKVCLCLLSSLHGINSSATKILQKLKNDQIIDSEILTQNLHRIEIKKFPQLFEENCSNDFKAFKQVYRLVVGHVFSKTHKLIDNRKLKSQIKLKLFCCHVVNRVFEKEHTHELFKYYYQWVKMEKKSLKFCFRHFSEWIKTQKSEKLIETIEIINNKFYKKNK